MITGLAGLTARCVRRGALFQPAHEDADDRAPGAVDGPGGRALPGAAEPFGPASSPIGYSAAVQT